MPMTIHWNIWCCIVDINFTIHNVIRAHVTIQAHHWLDTRTRPCEAKDLCIAVPRTCNLWRKCRVFITWCAPTLVIRDQDQRACRSVTMPSHWVMDNPAVRTSGFSVARDTMDHEFEPKSRRQTPTWAWVALVVEGVLVVALAVALAVVVIQNDAGVLQGRRNTGLILGLRLANERRRYKVTASLIGWAQT